MSEPLTEEDWAWFDRNRGRDGGDYYAMEFAALLDRARAENTALLSRVRELEGRVRTQANEWRKDYNACASERDALREALETLEDACDAAASRRSEETYLSMIADGAKDALDSLDGARRRARSLLQDKEARNPIAAPSKGETT